MSAAYIPPGSAPPPEPEPDRPMARGTPPSEDAQPPPADLDDELEELEEDAAQDHTTTPPQPDIEDVGGVILAADRSQLSRFVHALLPNLDPFGYVSLRAFRQFPPKGERDRPLHVEPIRLNLGLEPIIDAAERIALRVSNGGEAAVFAPPVCTFTDRKGAKASDVHEAPLLSVECDQGDLEQITDRLSLILGERPTIALYSGSVWTDPATGELLPKGHLHWRLRTPARGAEQQRMLRRARGIATLIAGGDPSATPQVHPLRWPGSWNRKAKTPVMARIVEENRDADVDLAGALAVLEDAAQAADLATPKSAAYLAADDRPAELAQLAGWLKVYTTACLPPAGQGLWHGWNCVAMAIHRATGGSEAGFDLFRAWSETGKEHYSEAGCRARWDAITGCPATWIGARFIRRMAVAHGWTAPAPAQPEEVPPTRAAPEQETGAASTEPEPPPRQSEDEDFVLPIEFSENALSYLFSARHQDRLVFVHGWGKWLRYHAGRWHEDHTVRVYDAARAICAEQGENALRTLPKSGNKVAAIINKASCVAAIERLARHHEPQTRQPS